MDRNEMIEKIIKSEIKREQTEIIYEILKLEIGANNDSIENFGKSNYLLCRGVEKGIKMVRELIEKRYNYEKN